jgi:hypothetical protein
LPDDRKHTPNLSSPWTVDIRHLGKTIVACSLSLIRSFGPSGRPQTVGIFLGRLVAQLQLRGSRFTTTDLDDAVRLALKGLIQKFAA